MKRVVFRGSSRIQIEKVPEPQRKPDMRNQECLKRLVAHRFKMSEIGKAMHLIDTAVFQTMKVILEW